MKKKILFVLNTYDFMISGKNKNFKIDSVYNNIQKKSSYWVNDFCKILKKDYKIIIDYPKINQKFNLDENYEDVIKNKIFNFNPDLIYCNFTDKNIQKLFQKIKGIKKILWLSVKISEKEIIELKNSYNYIISGNQNIHKLAKKNNFKYLKLMISSPAYKTFSKTNFLKRKKEIYFSGSLGNDFKYRLQILELISQKFKTKFRIRHLIEKYYFLQSISNRIKLFFPNFTNYLFKRKILPISNSLKNFNNNEVFGKELLRDMSNYQFVINVHSKFDQNNNINSRVFEALSCGCLLFCEENKYMKKIFKDNKHVVYFKTFNELQKKINYFRVNQSKAFAISNSGNKLFNKFHTSKKRVFYFKKIINKLLN